MLFHILGKQRLSLWSHHKRHSASGIDVITGNIETEVWISIGFMVFLSGID